MKSTWHGRCVVSYIRCTEMPVGKVGICSCGLQPHCNDRLSPSQCHILLLIPSKRLEKVVSLKIGPHPIYDKEVRIN